MIDYVELHCHSSFSLLDGASTPEELLDRAAELGMGALALTDHDALYGAVRFWRAAQARGIKPILGVELTLKGGHHLVLLARDRRGWANLCRLISLAHRAAPGKGRAALSLAALRGRTEGLICLSGCRRGEIAAHLLAGRPEEALRAGERYVELFGRDSFWIELERHLLPGEVALTGDLVELAGRLGVGYVATNNVHYAERRGHRLQDVLVCIKHHTTLNESARLRRPNSECYLKSARQMAALFPEYPEALEATRLIADRCRFQLSYGLQDLPRFPTPGGAHPASYLRRLCEEGVRSRYPAVTPRLREQMAHELAVIDELGLANYFLIVWDIVRFARQRGILCQGRGSAANSVVAFLLGITPIDPLAHDLVFERFLSRERRMAPDIDIDFQANRRDEVIQYVYQRYGEEHAAMACTFVTFRARSALRDVGKALGFPPDLLDRAAKALYTCQAGDIAGSAGFAEALGDRMEHLPACQLLELCRQIEGFPRHLSIHNGGMIITASPLVAVVPTEPAAMPGRVVVQWDKDSLEDVDLVKIDLLGLRALSAMAEAVETVEQATGKRPLVSGLTFDDPEVYDLICAGDTVGVFQLESRAQAQMIPRLQPRNFQDLVVETSLVRPGPLQGDMVRPYLRRRRGEEPVSYLHPLLESALAETLGVILFQEQVLKVARDLAGFTPGKAELLRRALGRKQEVGRWRRAFIRGAASRGVPASVAEGVFEKLLAFGGYSFPKSHAASFAVLVYRSAWLKRYHPLAFYAAILDSQPMGFWSPEVVAEDAKRHGVRILPVDVNCSRAKCMVEGGGIRLGFACVDGMGEAAAARLEEAREEGPFVSLSHFCRRTRLPRPLVEKLVLAGAMDSWGRPRRRLLWELGEMSYEEELDLAFPDEGVELAPLSRAEKVAAEYQILGLSTGEHVMALYQPYLAERGVTSSQDLEGCGEGQRVAVAGLVVAHKVPPTAAGCHFITLEDEQGLIDVVVRPDVYERCRPVLREAPLLMVEGRVERRGGLANVLARRAAALPERASS